MLGIETLGLLLEVNAFQVQGANAAAGLVIELARYPGKGMGGIQAVFNLSGIGPEHPAQDAGGGVDVRDFRGHRENRIHSHRPGKLVAVAVIDVAAHRRDFNTALLLAQGLPAEESIVHDLYPHQANTDGHEPEENESGQDVKAGVRVGGRFRHELWKWVNG